MTVTLEVGEAREETGRGPFSSSGPLQSRPEVYEDTANIDEQKDVLTKKDPEDGLVTANDKLARQKLNSSSDIGSKQFNEFASSEVNTCGKKKVS